MAENNSTLRVKLKEVAAVAPNPAVAATRQARMHFMDTDGLLEAA